MVANLAESRSHNTPAPVFLKHYREIREAKDKVIEANGYVKAAKKAAKASGVDMPSLKLLDMLTSIDTDEAELMIRKTKEYATYLNLPLGSQLNMFGEAPIAGPSPEVAAEQEEWEAGAAGQASGKMGGLRDSNPNAPGTATHVAWVKGWLKGHKLFNKDQARIANEMAPKEPMGERELPARGRRKTNGENASHLI